MNHIKVYAIWLLICFYAAASIQTCFAENDTCFVSQYDSVEPFINGYACVEKNEVCGLVNEENQLIVPVMYDFVKTFDSLSVYTDLGYCKVGLESGTGVYNVVEQKLLIPCNYDAVYYKELPTGTYFIMQKYPLIEVNDGWWELYDFDIYDTDGNLVYRTTAFYIDTIDGCLEECVLCDETASYDILKGGAETYLRAIELPYNSGNKYKTAAEYEYEYTYSYDKEKALREAHDEIYIYWGSIFYIAVDDDTAYYVDIDGNAIEYTKINGFENDWEAIKVNGKIFAEYKW